MTDDILAKHRGIIYKAYWNSDTLFTVVQPHFGGLIEIKVLNKANCHSYHNVPPNHMVVTVWEIEKCIPINISSIMEYIKALVLK